MPPAPPMLRRMTSANAVKPMPKTPKKPNKSKKSKKPKKPKKSNSLSKSRTESLPITQAQINAVNAWLNGTNAYRTHLKKHTKGGYLFG